jgi:uncharacterized protein
MVARNMPGTLKDKVIFITGASSGFGADVARLFAAEGAQVILTARRMDRLAALAEAINMQGGRALALPLDVTDYSQLEQAVAAILEKYGRIDILFNNSGFGRLNWLEELHPTEDIESMLAVNLTALIQLTRLVLLHMYQQGCGHIINMASIAGYIPAPLYTIYAATKHGVRGFTNALRREAEPCGVRVSGIYPGGALTEFSQHTGENPFKRNVKLPKFLYMTSEKVARRVVRLAEHPRRTVLMPGFYYPVALFDYLFPAVVDWILGRYFVKRYHKPNP